MFRRLLTLIKRNWIFYLFGVLTILGMKLFYSGATSDELDWALAPTTRWVSILSGIAFKKAPGVGYINHDIKFIIAASCSGVQFMIIVWATLFFSFTHKISATWGKILWFGSSLVSSYIYTILINGIRIFLSIRYQATNAMGGLLTSERLHTIEGVLVYMSSLLIIYHVTGLLFRNHLIFCTRGASEEGLTATRDGQTTTGDVQFAVGRAQSAVERELSAARGEQANTRDGQYAYLKSKPTFSKLNRIICYCLPPVIWYLAITVGIPFLNGANKLNNERFTNFAALIIGLCIVVSTAFCLTVFLIKRRFGCQKLSDSKPDP